jgi:hypothetical protein
MPIPTATSCRRTSAIRGWIGVRLDRDLGPDEVAGLIEDAHEAAGGAPKGV